jgi:dihydroneopterin aldolase
MWDATQAQSGHYDKILVQDLEVTVNAGTDVWGRKKRQRALISVTITLDKKFESASSTDTVDNSTIHYGILSKAIQARLQNDDWVSTGALSESLVTSVKEVAGTTPIFAIETSVYYPKGSMFGDGVSHKLSITEVIGSPRTRSDVLYLRNLRIPCLIGVNPNERLQKQPVLVNLWIDGIQEMARIDDYAQLETLLFEVRARQT